MIITVRGTPAPQGSKRHVGNGRMIEMSKAVGPWREAVRAEVQRAMESPDASGWIAEFDGPVDVRILFLVKRPKGHYRTGGNAHLLRPAAPGIPATAPDDDKLARAVLDGLTAGGAWKDDGQVSDLMAFKRYADDFAPPGCIISLRPATVPLHALMRVLTEAEHPEEWKEEVAR